jgi:C4-dicarboxylate transporter DctM subunit
LMISLFFILIIYGWCKLDPKLGPKGKKSTWAERLASLPEFAVVLIIFLLMIWGLMKGFFTPTEAGSVGTGLVIFVSFMRRDLDFKGFIKSVVESLRTACMVLMLIAGSTILGHFLAVSKIPMIAADWVVTLPLNRFLIMIVISLIYQTGGSFIDDLAFMVLATPIFYPVILKLGFDPIWFGMIIAITVMIGVVIPPVAINVFVVKNITKVPFSVIYSGVYPFLISLGVCAALLFVFPQLALWLPNLLMK